MHAEITKRRFMIKAIVNEGERPTEIAHPENNHAHPLSYLELPYDPEYSLYNNRMTPEFLNNVSADEQYWAVRRDVIFRNTGEFPVEISGPDAIKFANYIFTRDITKTLPGRCSYQFACYHDGCMITDGVMLHLAADKLWMAQADGDLFNWYLAHSENFDVQISDPKVWVTQIQGPKSMHVLRDAIDGEMPKKWNYFDLSEVKIAGQRVIISRTGFSNELGWEIYLRPENDPIAIGEKIWCSGKRYDMVLTGTPAFRARRIEAGLLSAGNDFDRTTTPFDVGLGRFVDMTKIEFIGRAALEKCYKKSKILGIKVRKGIAKRGHFISNEGKILGSITSSTWSPDFKCGVGIVHCKDDQAVEGLQVNVEGIDGNSYVGHLCQLPMYDKDGLIVRGKVSAIPTKPKPWDG